MRISGIYGIFSIDGKVLIGSSVDIHNRWTQHKSLVRRNLHANDHFQAAWNKYGADSFEFRILEECPVELLLTQENAYIKRFNSLNREFGYNLIDANRGFISEETRRKIGDGNRGKHVSLEVRRKLSKIHGGENHYCFGKHLSSETKAKISKARTGMQLSLEHKKKVSASLMGNHRRKGIPHTEETKEHLRQVLTGRKHSDETRFKISLANKGKKFTDEHLRNMSIASTGRHHTEEAKAKCSLASKKRWDKYRELKLLKNKEMVA